uniref:RdRp n=1 Tax=Plasmopara viticola lesion associated sobemo-like 1 TaxID=2692075 RepID=A0A6B9Q471_9VIRU|nr:RdRp [Plasmopara viticola lesion associated sobemo-like 1]
MDSTPGKCVLQRLGTTNGQILGWDGVNCDPERLKFVKAVVYDRFLRLKRGESHADNINVFIKQEPHKIDKIRDERFRLISAVSLVDTLIDRILFGWLGRRALNTVGKTPCLVGWTPLRGGWREMKAYYQNKPVICLDRSSWDWTVQEHVVDFWRQFVVALAPGAADWWVDMVNSRFDLLFRDARFEFSDGTVVQQPVTGIMKSGCYLTLLLNSVSQSYLHYLAQARLGESPRNCQPHCVGDDTVQFSMKDPLAYAKQLDLLGARVKGCKVQHWVEFCGFAFTNTCFPVYWKKHLYKLKYSNLSDVLVSYQIIYANEPEMFQLLQKIALRVDPELVLSGVEAKAIMNG